MNKIFANIICSFIPNREKRRLIRRKLNKKSTSELLLDINSRLNNIEKNIKTLYNFQHFLLPPLKDISMSEGWMRKVHMAGGKMLELVDIICRDHNIPYFLYAGSLIGAILYEKSLPWDDDWDIGMLRNDWEKFRDICEKLFKNSDFSPLFIGFSIQMQYKNTVVRGDVFPFDQYYKPITTTKELVDLQRDILIAKKNCKWEWWHWEEAFALENRSVKFINKEDYDKTKKVYSDYILKGNSEHPNGDLLENAVNPGHIVNNRLCHYTNTKNIFSYNWIFPLKRIKYESVEVFAPNNSDLFLKRKFGEYDSWPTSLESHNLKTKLTYEMIDDIDEFLKKDMNELYKELKHNSMS